MAATVRIGSANIGGAELNRHRTVDYRLESPTEVLEKVDRWLGFLEQMIHKAGKAGCDVVAFSEDTLGLSCWEAAHWDSLGEVLPEAVRRMLDRLGGGAGSHN